MLLVKSRCQLHIDNLYAWHALQLAQLAQLAAGTVLSCNAARLQYDHLPCAAVLQVCLQVHAARHAHGGPGDESLEESLQQALEASQQHMLPHLQAAWPRGE
jgi:hypothetical protein